MTIKPATVSTMALRCFTPANLRVRATPGCSLNTVVAPVARLMPASVECGRMLVSISLDAIAEPDAILESVLADEESLTRAVPSARQKTSVSSGSIRLHEGQRFILRSASCQLAASKLEFTQATVCFTASAPCAAVDQHSAGRC